MQELLKTALAVSVLIYALRAIVRKDAEKIKELQRKISLIESQGLSNSNEDAKKIAALEKKIGALEAERRIHIKRMNAERDEAWVKAIGR